VNKTFLVYDPVGGPTGPHVEGLGRVNAIDSPSKVILTELLSKQTVLREH
jgi:hypothetical protein